MVMANNTTSTIQRLGKSKKYFQTLREVLAGKENKPKGLKVAKEDQMADLADLRDQRDQIFKRSDGRYIIYLRPDRFL